MAMLENNQERSATDRELEDEISRSMMPDDQQWLKTESITQISLPAS